MPCAKHAVEHDEVVVRVDVEGRAEAMKEADGSDLGFGRRSWARAAQGGANRAQEDLEHGAGDALEVRTQALPALGDCPAAEREVESIPKLVETRVTSGRSGCGMSLAIGMDDPEFLLNRGTERREVAIAE